MWYLPHKAALPSQLVYSHKSMKMTVYVTQGSLLLGCHPQ